jgi:hypothetical protein
MTSDLDAKNARLRETINRLVESHPEVEAVVRDIALAQPTDAGGDQVQENLKNRARAIIEARPDLERSFE